METVILKLKETIIYLSTCLNEERIHNQQLQKVSAQRLEEALQSLSLKHTDDISACLLRYENEKREIEVRNKILLEKIKQDCQEAFLKLQAEHSLLKASFKNYRFEIRDEMNTVLMFKIRNFLDSQKEYEENVIKKNEKMMEEMYNKKLEHAKSQFCSRINYIMDENRRRLGEMELIYIRGKYDFRKKSKQEENAFEAPKLREVDDFEVLEENVKKSVSYVNPEETFDPNVFNLVQKANKATNTVEPFENKLQKTHSFNKTASYKSNENNLKASESTNFYAPTTKRSSNKDIKDSLITKLEGEIRHYKDEIKALQQALAEMTTRHESCEEIAKTEFQSRVVAEDKLVKYKTHYRKLDKAYNSLLSTYVISEVDKKNLRKKHGVRNESSSFSLNSQRDSRNQLQGRDKLDLHGSSSDIFAPHVKNFELDLEPYESRKPRLPALSEKSYSPPKSPYRGSPSTKSPRSPSPRAPAHSLKSQPTSPVHENQAVDMSKQNADLDPYDRRKVYNPKSLPAVGRFKPNMHASFSTNHLVNFGQQTAKIGPTANNSGGGQPHHHPFPFGKSNLSSINEGRTAGKMSVQSLPARKRMAPLPEVPLSRLESASTSSATTYHNFNSNNDFLKKY